MVHERKIHKIKGCRLKSLMNSKRFFPLHIKEEWVVGP